MSWYRTIKLFKKSLKALTVKITHLDKIPADYHSTSMNPEKASLYQLLRQLCLTKKLPNTRLSLKILKINSLNSKRENLTKPKPCSKWLKKTLCWKLPTKNLLKKIWKVKRGSSKQKNIFQIHLLLWPIKSLRLHNSKVRLQIGTNRYRI